MVLGGFREPCPRISPSCAVGRCPWRSEGVVISIYGFTDTEESALYALEHGGDGGRNKEQQQPNHFKSEVRDRDE